MSRQSDDNLSSINSAYTDMYQETVRRFTRSSLSPDLDRRSASPSFRSSLASTTHRSEPDRRLSFDHYIEATGRRRSSDQGAVLTVDTEQFIIGQRVWVGGARPGQIAFIGETHFAPGEWAGIVLDEPNGKNDGCVAGKRYFQCEPKRGIFSRLTRLTLAPLPGAIPPSSPLSKYTPDRSRTVSPTTSLRSSLQRSPGKNGLNIGDRVIVSSGFGSRPGILRYLGETRFASGNWCGIELDEPTGKNDGSVDGFRYFDCQPKYGVFVPIAKVSLSPLSKKLSRASRAGSRESLTSIGTMNSVANTNTSRLRMSAQRKTTAIKPNNTVTKCQFSMQDLLREKQNHIEQLMIERDLDREDAQNQALQFQKTISELSYKVSDMERKLATERNKTEELQLSVDEATFCGDELNAQTQVYRERITELERRLSEMSAGASYLISAIKEENSVMISKIPDNLRILLSENANLQEEMLHSCDCLENLSANGIENIQRALATIDGDTNYGDDGGYSEATPRKAIQGSADEDFILPGSSTLADGNKKDVHRQLQKLTEHVTMLTSELSVQKAESATLDEMLTNQRSEMVAEQRALHEKIAENEKLTAELICVRNLKANIEEQLAVAQDLIKSRNESQRDTEEKEGLKVQILGFEKENERLRSEVDSCLRAKNAQDDEVRTITAALEAAKETNETLQRKFVNSEEESKRLLAAKIEEIECSHAQVQELREQLAAATTTTMKTQLNADESRSRILELEMNNKNLELLLQSTREQMTAASEELSQKVKTLHELELKWERTQCSNVDLERQLDASEEQRQQLELAMGNGVRECESLRTKCANYATQSEQLQRDMVAARTSCTELQSNIKKLNEDLTQQQRSFEKEQSTLSAENMELKNGVAQLKQQLAKSTKDGTEVRDTLATVQRELQARETLYADLDANASKRELALSDALRQVESLHVKCNALTEKNDCLQNDLYTLQTPSEDTNRELRTLAEALASKEKAYDRLVDASNAERSTLETQLQASQQRLNVLGEQLTKLKDELTGCREEDAKRGALLQSTQDCCDKQELELSDALRKLEALTAKVTTLERHNESLSADATTLRATTNEAANEVLRLTEESAAKEKVYNEERTQLDAAQRLLQGQLQEAQQTLEAKQRELHVACVALQDVKAERQQQCEEHERRLGDIQLAAEKNVEDVQRREQEERRTYCQHFEQQMAESETRKLVLDEAITNLQGKIKLLQDEFMKSQLDFKAKEDDFTRQLNAYVHDIEQHEEQQARNTTLCEELREQNAELTREIVELRSQLKASTEANVATAGVVEQQKAAAESRDTEKATLEMQLQTMRDTLALCETDLEHRTRTLDEHKTRIATLSGRIKLLESSNSNMSATNARLSDALKKLEGERCETAHNFELFEMETDQNEAHYRGVHTQLQQRLSESQSLVESRDKALGESQVLIERVLQELQTTKSALETFQNQAADDARQQDELRIANEALNILVAEKEQQMQQLKLAHNEDAKRAQDSTASALMLVPVPVPAPPVEMNMVKKEETKEQTLHDNVELSKSKERPQQPEVDAPGRDIVDITDESETESTTHIKFLHSIIADMQKKNDTLKARIETLEAMPMDFTNPETFEIFGKRKPMPRLFCDICDVFDEHETEDCPLQTSEQQDSVAHTESESESGKRRILPEPRKYCESCEVFGHESGECDDEYF